MYPATEQYPLDTVEAKFSGIVTLTGDLSYMDEDDELFPNSIMFKPSNETLNKLPISHHDTRGRWFLI